MLKRLMAVACATLTISAAASAQAANLTGAGATFPAPIYSNWAQTYHGQTGAAVNYQAIGSGGGIKQIKARTVDFGASDKPLKPEDLAAAGLFQFPTVVGGVVPVMNLPGIRAGQIKLTGALLADIYLGAVNRWNDPRLKALNPNVPLPNLPITVVHRSDGSGTSFLFTSYLSMKNPTWAAKVGGTDAPPWPTGLGGKGNDGVAAFVRQQIGAIGYVEYAYAVQNHMDYALMQNKQGAFVPPDANNFGAAASHGDWSKAPGFYLLLLDQPGAASWPITGATFILVYKQQANPQTGAEVLKFFDWAYKNGDAAAAQLNYVALPLSVKNMVRKAWVANIKGPNGQPVYVSH